MRPPARAAALGPHADAAARDEAFAEHLFSLNDLYHDAYGVPLRLSDLGVERAQLEAVAKQARYDGAALYNATDVTVEDALRILEAAY